MYSLEIELVICLFLIHFWYLIKLVDDAVIWSVVDRIQQYINPWRQNGLSALSQNRHSVIYLFSALFGPYSLERHKLNRQQL